MPVSRRKRPVRIASPRPLLTLSTPKAARPTRRYAVMKMSQRVSTASAVPICDATGRDGNAEAVPETFDELVDEVVALFDFMTGPNRVLTSARLASEPTEPGRNDMGEAPLRHSGRAQNRGEGSAVSRPAAPCRQRPASRLASRRRPCDATWAPLVAADSVERASRVTWHQRDALVSFPTPGVSGWDDVCDSSARSARCRRRGGQLLGPAASLPRPAGGGRAADRVPAPRG